MSAVGSGFLPTGVRCDRCGREEHQRGMIHGYTSVIAEGWWAWRERPDADDENLCGDCLTGADLAAGFTRN